MASVNEVTLIGNLGDDPVTKELGNGATVTKFSIATNRIKKDRATGEKIKVPDWHKVVAWNKLGDICSKYLKKGKPVYIKGEIQYDNWENKEGNKIKLTNIVANKVEFLAEYEPKTSSSPSSKNTSPAPDKYKDKKPEGSILQDSNDDLDIDDDDIPF